MNIVEEAAASADTVITRDEERSHTAMFVILGVMSVLLVASAVIGIDGKGSSPNLSGTGATHHPVSSNAAHG
jgi:hypothetical protein